MVAARSHLRRAGPIGAIILTAMKRGLLTAVLVLNLAACATVQHGPMQRIYVESDPPEARVHTENCGPGSTKSAQTPGVVWVNRRAEHCTLTISAPQYEPATVVLERAIAEEFLENLELVDATCSAGDCYDFGFFLFGGLLAGTGFGVDSVTGAMFEQHPNHVRVELTALDER
jgi:hypothetical protein